MKKCVLALLITLSLGIAAKAVWAGTAAPGSNFTVICRLWTDAGYQIKDDSLATNQYGLTMQGKLRDSYTTSFFNINGNSYFGAKWTSSDRSTGAHVELAPVSAVGNQELVWLRYAYGWWQQGDFKLVAGHTDGVFGSLFAAPGALLGGTQSLKSVFVKWGYLYSGRIPQVRAEYRTKIGLLSLALAQANAERTDGQELLTVGGQVIGSSQLYNALPRLDAAWAVRTENLMIIPGFSISMSQYDGASAGRDDSVVNWVASIPLTYNIERFSIKAQAYYGANIDTEWGQLSAASFFNQPPAVPVWAVGNVESTYQAGGTLQLGYTIDKSTIMLAGGYVYSTNDNWKKLGYAEDNYSRWVAMLAWRYRVNNYFSVQPEVKYCNYGKSVRGKITDLTGNQSSDDYGAEWLVGASFMFVF